MLRWFVTGWFPVFGDNECGCLFVVHQIGLWACFLRQFSLLRHCSELIRVARERFSISRHGYAVAQMPKLHGYKSMHARHSEARNKVFHKPAGAT
jgi:hypothetical protein